MKKIILKCVQCKVEVNRTIRYPSIRCFKCKKLNKSRYDKKRYKNN